MNITELNDAFIGRLLNLLEQGGFLSHVEAVIVSGSFGRNEPTYRIIDENINYLSDVEIALVYKTWIQLSWIKKHKRAFEDSFKEASVELMPISSSRLKAIRNHNYSFLKSKKITVFTYDFYNGSKTIYGKDFIRNKVCVNKIDAYEGKRLIGNRVSELVYCKNNCVDYREINRWLAKTILALGTSFVLSQGFYNSSYCEQFNLVVNSEEIKRFYGEDFINLYEKAFLFLRKGVEGFDFSSSEDNIRNYVRILNDFYEKNGIVKNKTACFYTFVREALLLIKFDLKRLRCIINPKELIYSNILRSYADNMESQVYWSNAWKKVLN